MQPLEESKAHYKSESNMTHTLIRDAFNVEQLIYTANACSDARAALHKVFALFSEPKSTPRRGIALQLMLLSVLLRVERNELLLVRCPLKLLFTLILNFNI